MHGQTRRSACLLAVMLPVLIPEVAPAADEPKAGPASGQEHILSLQGGPEERQRLAFIGPEAEQCVSFEPAGLRVKLPAGFLAERPFTGVNIGIPVRGDFDISVRFEILHEPSADEVGKAATRLTLGVSGNALARLTRRIAQNGATQFATWTVLPAGTERPRRYQAFPTRAMRGRLRLVRLGAELSYYAAEGDSDDFTLLHKVPFGAGDIDGIELAGVTGGPQAALDGRFADLRIRTGPLVGASPPTPPAPKGVRWRLWLAALIGMVLVLGVWLQVRHASKQPAPDVAPPAA